MKSNQTSLRKRARALPKVAPAKGRSSRVAKGKMQTRSLAKLPLPKELLRRMFSLMLKSRVLEERLIKIYKAGEAFFWIGGPGEEGFGVPLGMLVQKGQGPDFDYLHLHYRSTPTLVAMGMKMEDAVRLIMNRATDPCAGGRNFANHYCFPEWNVVPVSSPIGVQYSMALGTAHIQAKRKTTGVSVVTGGDAGTAAGDFASALVWSTRPGAELPMLITVQNNGWGISTAYQGQHGEERIADRGRAFGMRTCYINGNDPIESYMALSSEFEYIRKTRKPVLLEARVSRLYGHSSASGANLLEEEDPLTLFADRILQAGVLTKSDIEKMRDDFQAEALAAQEKVRGEPHPLRDSIWDHVYVGSDNGDWRKF